MERIVDGCYAVPLGMVNAFLLEIPGGLALVDSGFPGREGDILSAIRSLGRAPSALQHVVLTHAHPDHVGSAAAIVRATGAQTWMHADDVPVAENSEPMRPIHPSPGLLPKLLFTTLMRMPARWDAVKIDHVLADGDVLPFAPLRVIHVPGHCKGQIALTWQ